MEVTQLPQTSQSNQSSANNPTEPDAPAWQAALSSASDQVQTNSDQHAAIQNAKANGNDPKKSAAQTENDSATTETVAPSTKPAKISQNTSSPDVKAKVHKKDSTQSNQAQGTVNAALVDIPASPAENPQPSNGQAIAPEAHAQSTVSEPAASSQNGDEAVPAGADENTKVQTGSSPSSSKNPIAPEHASPELINQRETIQAKPSMPTNTETALATQATSSPAPATPQHAPAHATQTALPPEVETKSTAHVLAIRAAQIPDAASDLSDTKIKGSTQDALPLTGLAVSQPSIAVASTGSNITATPASDPSTAATPSALAATVTALHQSGQAAAVLRLDPPGLGHLSVQVGLGAQGQVNVLFVPSTADAAHAIQSSLPGLGSAMAQSGLTLGQAQLGGQFSQQNNGGQQNAYTPPRQTSFTANATTTSTPAQVSGLSAYA